MRRLESNELVWQAVIQNADSIEQKVVLWLILQFIHDKISFPLGTQWLFPD